MTMYAQPSLLKDATRYGIINPLCHIGLDKQFFERIIVHIFLPINDNICLRYSKEPSH